jgi:hypothetical protein
LGEIQSEDFRLLVEQIVKSIQVSYTVDENRLLCEELVDCLLMMWKACATKLGKSSWTEDCLKSLRLVAESNAAPGLTNKAKFGLMDLLDIASGKKIR